MQSLKKNHQINNESGQGTVEYILVLVVVVGVVLGGVYQLNDAFRRWGEAYFGDYLACLLETGELPSIGGNGGVAGLCNQEFAEFSLTQGRPLIGDSIGGGAGDGAAGGEGRNSGDEEDRANSRGPGRAAGGSRTGRNTARFRASRGRGRSALGATGSVGLAKGSGAEAGGDGLLNVAESSQGQKARKVQFRNAASINYGTARKKKKAQKEVKKKAAFSKEDEKLRRAPLVKVAPPIKKSSQKVDIEEFTFGNFLRYIIIAAILIALLLLLGGQALQISKSIDGS